MGFEGFYEICACGQITSLDRLTTGKHGTQKVKGKPIKPIRNKAHGYYVVGLAKNGVVKQYRLHILVAKHFIPNPENKPTVNHKSGIKSENFSSNLEWATSQAQMTHASLNGLTASGERNGGNKLKDYQVHQALQECLSGIKLVDVAEKFGVNRNTLPKAFKRLGVLEQWVQYRKTIPNEFIEG